MKNTTILKDYILLQSVFLSLQKDRLIKENVFINVEKPRSEEFEIDESNIYDYSDFQKLRKLLFNSQIELPVFLAISLGLRRSEIVGLKWNNVFFDKNYIFIKNAVVVIKGELIEKATKTKKSTRKLEISPFIKELLLKELNKQKEISKNTKINYKYVMSNYATGESLSPDYITRTFGRLLKKHNLKHIRFHDLRHSFASIANELGITLYDISTALGHSSTSITSKIYVHLFSDTNKKIINTVSDYFTDNNE